MTEDELARRGLRALLMGQLVLSKEEGEELVAKLLGSNDLEPGSSLRLELTWVIDGGRKPVLIDRMRIVTPRVVGSAPLPLPSRVEGYQRTLPIDRPSTEDWGKD